MMDNINTALLAETARNPTEMKKKCVYVTLYEIMGHILPRPIAFCRVRTSC